VFYAEEVADSDDPLFIVPAVIPDDAPAPQSAEPKGSVKEKSPDRPSLKKASGATTQVVAVPQTEQVPQASGAEPVKRTIRFERPAVRRTTRTLRYIDPWSVFRVALVAHFVLYLVLLLAGVLLWNVANATGTVDNVERFMESFGWESFEFNGGELFHQAWVLGLFAVVGLTGLVVLAVTTFNLITDLVGGIRLTVLEGRPARRSVGLNPVNNRPQGDADTSTGIPPGG
jgi:hypothetical protein